MSTGGAGGERRNVANPASCHSWTADGRFPTLRKSAIIAIIAITIV
jgi:hypothetical protein